MQTHVRTENRPAAELLPRLDRDKRKTAAAETAAVADVLAAGEAPQTMKQLGVKELQKLLQAADFVEPEEGAPEEAKAAETRDAVARAEAKLRRQLAGVVDNASRTAVAALVANGISLDKISLDVLNGLLAEIEANPALESSEEAVRERVAALTEEYNLLPEVARRFAEYARALADAGAAVTVKNLLALENADGMYAKLTDMDDTEIVSVLREDVPLTLERACHERFRVPKPRDMSDADWAGLASSLRKSFAREGIAETAENLRNARLLLANDAAASKENIHNARFLRRVTQALTRDDVLARGAERIALREPAASFIISESNTTDTEAALAGNLAVADALPGLTGAHIDLALLQSQAPTLGALTSLPNPAGTAPQTGGDAVRFKRQLAELQVVMTREAAARLARKGFRLETALPEDALHALQELEKADAASALRQAGAADSPQNVAALTALSGQLRSFRFLPPAAYPELLENRAKLTPASVSVMAALESYDLAATPVSAKHGDSFARVADQFASLLQAMNLPATEENLRAARLLSRSKSDVTQDNVLAVRGVQARLEHVAERLHPYLAARLIRDGLNPSSMPLDELAVHIAAFEAENGTTDAERVTAHIAALDRQNALNPAEREALLEVYRALHKAQRDDGAALGAAMRAGRTLTLANLAETADAFRRAAGRFSAVDVSLADGEAARNASSHAEAAFLARHTVSKVIRHAAPVPLHGLLGEGGADWALDDAARYLSQSSDAAVNAETAMRAALASVGRVPADSAAFLQACGVPLTAANLQLFRKLEREPDMLEEQWNEASEALAGEWPDGALSALQEGESPAALLERLADAADAAQAEDAAKPLDEVVRVLRLQSAIAAAARSFHIPVNRNGKIADVHIYMLNKQADAADAAVCLALGTRFGAVRIRAGAADGTLTIAAQADGAGAAALERHTDALAAAGLPVGSVTVERTDGTVPGGTAQRMSRRLRPAIDGSEVPKRIFTLATALLEWIQQAETDFGSTETDFETGVGSH